MSKKTIPPAIPTGCITSTKTKGLDELSSLPNPLENPTEDDAIAPIPAPDLYQPISQPRPSILKTLSWWLVGSVGGLCGIALLIVVFLGNRLVSCGAQAAQSEGRQYVSAFNRAQAAFYLENHQLAHSLEALNLGIFTQTKLFHYSATITPTAVFHYAIPLHSALYEKRIDWGPVQWETRTDKNLKRLVSAVFITPKNSKPDPNSLGVQMIVCEALEVGTQSPPHP